MNSGDSRAVSSEFGHCLSEISAVFLTWGYIEICDLKVNVLASFCFSVSYVICLWELPVELIIQCIHFFLNILTD